MNRMPGTYKDLNLPPLGEEQKAGLEALKQMTEDAIDYSDAPSL